MNQVAAPFRRSVGKIVLACIPLMLCVAIIGYRVYCAHFPHTPQQLETARYEQKEKPYLDKMMTDFKKINDQHLSPEATKAARLVVTQRWIKSVWERSRQEQMARVKH